MELATGAALAESSREKERLEEFLSSVIVLPYDKESAILILELKASLVKSGETMGDFDAAIGTIALAHGERILTRNTKPFRQIPGLVVEDYTKD